MKKILQERLEITEDINGTMKKADDTDIKVVENMRKPGR
jgi:hypothetical protein